MYVVFRVKDICLLCYSYYHGYLVGSTDLPENLKENKELQKGGHVFSKHDPYLYRHRTLLLTTLSHQGEKHNRQVYAQIDVDYKEGLHSSIIMYK